MRVAIHEMTMGGRDVSYNGLVGKHSMRVGNCTERQYPPACDTQVTAVDTRWNLKRAYPVTSRWAGTRHASTESVDAAYSSQGRGFRHKKTTKYQKRW